MEVVEVGMGEDTMGGVAEAATGQEGVDLGPLKEASPGSRKATAKKFKTRLTPYTTRSSSL